MISYQVFMSIHLYYSFFSFILSLTWKKIYIYIPKFTMNTWLCIHTICITRAFITYIYCCIYIIHFFFFFWGQTSPKTSLQESSWSHYTFIVIRQSHQKHVLQESSCIYIVRSNLHSFFLLVFWLMRKSINKIWSKSLWNYLIAARVNHGNWG